MVRLEARQGGHTSTNVDPRLYHDIQVQLNRLVSKASQLIGNETTECWMLLNLTVGRSSIDHRVALAWEQGLGRTLEENGDHRPEEQRTFC